MSPDQNRAPMIDAITPIVIERFADALAMLAQPFPAGRAERHGDVALMATGLPFVPCNQALIAGDGADAPTTLKRITAFFGPLPHMVQTWEKTRVDDLLRVTGYMDVVRFPLMIHPGPVVAASLPTGVDIREATPADLGAATAVASECFEIPREAMGAFLAPWMLDDPSVTIVVATEREQVVGTALGITRDAMTGVFNVATLSGHRRRGIGDALTRAVMRGERASFLQASALGEPVYERMGYRSVGTFTGWVRP